MATVEIYADAHRVQLLLNGKEVGVSSVGGRRPYLAEFTVPYEAGDLTAVAYRSDGTEIGDILRECWA